MSPGLGPSAWVRSGAGGHGDMLRVLLLEEALQEPLPALLHLDEAGLEPLPEFVVLRAASVARVPNVVLYELFDLVLPGWPQHVLLDALHGDHQPGDVLDEDIIAGYEELFLGL